MAEAPARVNVIHPPRLSGDPVRDLPAIQEWMYQFYNSLIIQGGLLQAADLSAQLQSQFPVLHALGVLNGIAADKLGYFTGATSWGVADLTGFSRGLLGLGDAASWIAGLGLVLTAGGTYTPTPVDVVNVDASVLNGTAQFARIASTVIFGGEIQIDATAVGTAQVRLDLPIASDLVAAGDLVGVCNAVGVTGVLSADTVNNEALISVAAPDGANRTYRFVGMYQL